MSLESYPPPVFTRPAQFAAVAHAIEAAATTIFVDVERASSFRYGDRAFLIQLHIPGHGEALLDPEAGEQTIGPVAQALSSTTVCLHACRADLPSLHALGVYPAQLHDTEIAAKLLAVSGFSLGHLVESYLGIHLPKAYSRADWSVRPLPEQWLHYAVDDVKYLAVLLEMLLEDLATVPVAVPEYYPATLRTENRATWYAETMCDMLSWRPAQPPPEQWRRLSNLSTLHGARELARARALWQARETIAARDDIAVHRIVRDPDLIAAASDNPRSVQQLRELPGFAEDLAQRYGEDFLAALRAANALPEGQLPSRRLPRAPAAVPSHRSWKHKAPHANELLRAARSRLTELSEIAAVEEQTLLASPQLRHWVWAAAHTTPDNHEPHHRDLLERTLQSAGALPWQIRVVAPALYRALNDVRAAGD